MDGPLAYLKSYALSFSKLKIYLMKPNIWWILAKIGSFFGIETFSKKKKNLQNHLKPPKITRSFSPKKKTSVKPLWFHKKRSFSNFWAGNRYLVSQKFASFWNFQSKYFRKQLVKIAEGDIIFNNLAKDCCRRSKPENILCCFESFLSKM